MLQMSVHDETLQVCTKLMISYAHSISALETTWFGLRGFRSVHSRKTASVHSSSDNFVNAASFLTGPGSMKTRRIREYIHRNNYSCFWQFFRRNFSSNVCLWLVGSRDRRDFSKSPIFANFMAKIGGGGSQHVFVHARNFQFVNPYGC